MHLDGLGDVADALGAAHRSPERFIEVLRDPHIGAYGTMAIVLQLIAKLVLLAAIASPPALAAVVLIAAWARWGALVWGTLLPPLASGSGERFTWHIDRRGMVAEGVILAAFSLWLAPVLLLAAVVIAGVAIYWKYRLGGITGDCLGAGIELTETMLLLLIAVQMA
jgi:adenosylcobinamide-GDP ribazoletransferase